MAIVWKTLAAPEPNLGPKPIHCHQVVVEQSAVFIAGQPARSPGKLVLETPKHPDGFQEGSL